MSAAARSPQDRSQNSQARAALSRDQRAGVGERGDLPQKHMVTVEEKQLPVLELGAVPQNVRDLGREK